MLGVRLGFALFGVFWGTWAVAALDIQGFLGLSDAGLGCSSPPPSSARRWPTSSAARSPSGTARDGRPPSPSRVWGPLVLLASAVPSPGAWMAVFLAVVAAGGMLDVVLNIASTGVLTDRPGRSCGCTPSYNLGTIVGAALTGATLAACQHVAVVVRLRRCRSAAARPAGALWRRSTIPEVTSGEHASLHEAVIELRRSRLVGLAVVFALGAMVEGGIGTFGVLYLRDRLDVAVLAGAGAYVVGQALATTTRYALGSEAAGAHLGGTRPAQARARSSPRSAWAWRRRPICRSSPASGRPSRRSGAATYWPLLSAVTTRAADRPGLAVGGVSAAGYLGFLAGPPIVGAIAEGAGLRAGVLALAVAGAAAASLPLSSVARRLAALDPVEPAARPRPSTT